MARTFEDIMPLIDDALHGKSGSQGGCYLRKEIALYIISADKPVTNDEMYHHLVGKGVFSEEKIPFKKFSGIPGQVVRKLDIIGSRENKVSPNARQYYLKKDYKNTEKDKIKDHILKYITDYNCP